MHPHDVLSGEGAARIGGRFVPVGTRAIYAADSEEATFRELTARKHRLAGQAQFDMDRYPRITYRVDIDAERCLDVRSLLDQPESTELVRRCLDFGDLRTSQEVGKLLSDQRVQAILYPSVVAFGFNIVIFRALVTDEQVSLYRKEELLAFWERHQ
jgi:RES domain-containing protein